MDGAERNTEQQTEKKPVENVQETNVTLNSSTARPLDRLDSFERIEAELLQQSSLEDDEPTSSKDKKENYFCEDYTIKEGTYLDTGKPDHSHDFDILRDLEKLERLRKLEIENEEDLERREVAALIKKAEEKLLPPEKEVEDTLDVLKIDKNAYEKAMESEETLPELAQIEKSKDLQDDYEEEEEGFRLRLSCILEESESDTASVSGSVVKAHPLTIVPAKIIAAENKDISNPKKSDISYKSIEQKHSEEQKYLDDLSEIPSQIDKNSNNTLDSSQEISTKSVQDEITEIRQLSDDPSDIEKVERNVFHTDVKEDQEDSIGTPSISPELKSFNMQKLKSGNHVDKLLTKQSITKRLEYSSDSSLDISSTISTSGAETDAFNPIEKNDTKDNQPNFVESEINPEGNKPTDFEITELTDNDNIIEDCNTTHANVIIQSSTEDLMPAYCEIVQLTDEDVNNLFPKIKKVRRGKSLESGLTEKLLQAKEEQDKEDSKLETKSQKGDDRPPVPPETYLWEELRRWRLKGGYPWTHLDKPPFDEETWKKIADHEYEPINPPPLESITEGPRRVEGNIEEERHFLRIPRDEELVVSAEDMEVEAIAQDLDEDFEGRYLSTTPMTTTTASRTDCDVNTSMLDSSGLEDLPLKRGSRTKKAIQSKTEQMRAQAQGIQQRLRSQAGKLRSKLRSIPRPSFQKKQERDRSPSSSTERKPRFRLPERPKFNFPERPKFKMPQKPKINLPNFTNPLRERQAHGSETKKNIFDIDFKTYPRIFSKKSRDRGDYATSSPKLPRSATPPPAPIQPTRKKGPIGQRWVNRFDDIKFVDDKESVSHRSELSESLSGFHDKDFAIADDLEQTELPPARTRSMKSSLSHLSDREIASSRSSEDRLRKGVIEEIDSDQFFLRQKGISEENIDMGKYLSDEIREAFKSPVVNALRQMDYGYEDPADIIQSKENVEPLPPTRTRSLRKGQSLNDEQLPQQRSPSPQLKVTDNVLHNNTPANVAQPKAITRYENLDQTEPLRYENIEDATNFRYENVTEDNEHYKSPPPPVEYQHYKVPRTVGQPTPMKRKGSNTEERANKKKQNGWVEVEVETTLEEVHAETIPQPLKRNKSKKGLNDQQESVEVGEKPIEPDYAEPIEEEISHPEPPIRRKSLSRGARSLHSIARDGEEAQYPEAPIRRSLSRGARSIQSIARETEDAKQPTAPKRASTRSIHSLGLSGERRSRKNEHDTRSLHSLAFDYDSKSFEAPKRTKSLTRGGRSALSLDNEVKNLTSARPIPPERNRSLSRGCRSYHSLAEDENAVWAPQSPDRTRSLSRSSKIRTLPRQERAEATHINRQGYGYEAPIDDGYAVVDKSTKPKPPRPPPPRKKKGSESPNFNTFPRRSPVRPIRAYATIGPSRPPRKVRPKAAQSLEHIYQSDHISQDLENTLKLENRDDIHGSNKDLQTEEVIEKMKGRPLPAPPRPPRIKPRSEEPASQSMEEVEEVCVSTQTDPLPDDLILEDDMMQELSHDEYKMQEAFLQEMREEDERIKREMEERKAKHSAIEQQITLEKEKEERLALEEEAKLRQIYLDKEAEKLRAAQLVIEEELAKQTQKAKDEEIAREAERARANELAQQAALATETESKLMEVAKQGELRKLQSEQLGSSSEPPKTPQRRLGPSQRSLDAEKKKKSVEVEAEDDMGYASLDRRQSRVGEPQPATTFQQQEQTATINQRTTSQDPVQSMSPPQPTFVPVIPEILNAERLRVNSLEVDSLRVNDLHANSLQVQELRTQALQTHELQSSLLQIQDIRSQAGQLTLGHIELPPDFLQQIIARIPWEEIRPPQIRSLDPEVSQPRRPPIAEEDEALTQQPPPTTGTRRRHRHLKQHSSRSQHSSDEEDTTRKVRRQYRQTLTVDPGILDLSRQLARACTNGGFRAVREFATQLQARAPQGEERTQYIKTIICLLLVAIAGYFILGFNGSGTYHNHWDFQFPPQPPQNQQ